MTYQICYFHKRELKHNFTFAFSRGNDAPYAGRSQKRGYFRREK
jgi:hypothetical protein